MRSTVVLGLVSSVWLASAAPRTLAQEAPSGLTLERAVLAACRTETATFCPRDEGAPARSGRNTAICLKPFKSNLSLSCRHAVSALFP